MKGTCKETHAASGQAGTIHSKGQNQLQADNVIFNTEVSKDRDEYFYS